MKFLSSLTFIFVLISFSATDAEKTGTDKLSLPETALRIQKMYEKQRKELPYYQLKIKKYDSTQDPFFQDKEVESDTISTEKTYSYQKVRQVVMEKKEIRQLAPPYPSYTWFTEYYFRKNELYYINFRYLLTMPSPTENTKYAVTEIIVFLPFASEPIAFRRNYATSKLDVERPMQWDSSFLPADLEEEDASGRTNATLRGGILEMTKRKYLKD